MDNDATSQGQPAPSAPPQPDPSAPLEVIRAKEHEIAVRLDSARAQADEIVAKARRDAAATIRQAEVEGASATGGRDEEIVARARQAAAELARTNAEQVEALHAQAAGHRDAAVRMVVDAVTMRALTKDRSR